MVQYGAQFNTDVAKMLGTSGRILKGSRQQRGMSTARRERVEEGRRNVVRRTPQLPRVSDRA